MHQCLLSSRSISKMSKWSSFSDKFWSASLWWLFDIFWLLKSQPALGYGIKESVIIYWNGLVLHTQVWSLSINATHWLTNWLMLSKLDDMTLHCWLKVILTAQWCPMWQLLISSGCWLKFVSLVTNPLLDWLARSCFVVLMPVNDANCLMMSQQVLKPTSQQDNVIITITMTMTWQ